MTHTARYSNAVSNHSAQKRVVIQILLKTMLDDEHEHLHEELTEDLEGKCLQRKNDSTSD